MAALIIARDIGHTLFTNLLSISDKFGVVLRQIVFMKGITSIQKIMKATPTVHFIALLSLCLCSVAAEPTNRPVRVTISLFSRPPEDRIIVTSTNMIARLVELFPGYEKQPADRLASGHWMVTYSVNIAFAGGRSRNIYIFDNRWTAGAEDYTALTQNWEDLLRSITNNFFKRTLSNTERLDRIHEPATFIIGPFEPLSGRENETKEQLQNVANRHQPASSNTNRASAAVGPAP